MSDSSDSFSDDQEQLNPFLDLAGSSSSEDEDEQVHISKRVTTTQEEEHRITTTQEEEASPKSSPRTKGNPSTFISSSFRDLALSSNKKHQAQSFEDFLRGKVTRNGQVVSESFVQTVIATIGGEEVSEPTIIQRECWKVLLQPATFDRDLIAIARTGSGKTLAFLVPVMVELKEQKDSILLNDDGVVYPEAVILGPTRELVRQIASVAQELARDPDIVYSLTCVLGGQNFAEQVETVRGERPRLVIATPGRLLSLCGKIPHNTLLRQKEQGVEYKPDVSDKCIDLSYVSSLVLDEADRMLDLGFAEDLNRISGLISGTPRIILTSATWEKGSRMDAAAKAFFKGEPIFISVEGAGLSVAKTVTQHVEIIKQKGAYRFKRLVSIIEEAFEKDAETKVIVFVLYKAEATELANQLNQQGFSAVGLQGDMSQTARLKALDAYRNDEVNILVGTDVASRGLDVSGVSIVVNYSLGMSIETYVHRVGRCGRAGRDGVAYTFLVKGDEKLAPGLVDVLQEGRQNVTQDLRILASKELKRREKKPPAKKELDEEQLLELEQRKANREKQLKMHQNKINKGGGGRKGRRKRR